MRCEQEIMNMLLRIAKEDERILALYMNGSRVNPTIEKDIFQDYDIVYVVSETASFRKSDAWLAQFGDILMMQKPEAMDEQLQHPCNLDHNYGYLMQFWDGNRIDLHLKTLNLAIEEVLHTALTKVLYDKENYLPLIAESSDEDHWVSVPTLIDFQACCNEFWWIQNNVVKGLWRNEIPYVMDMINIYIRPQLFNMLGYRVAHSYGYRISIGKSGKLLPRFVDETTWKEVLATYAIADVEAIWQAAFTMCNLFSQTAKQVSQQHGFAYIQQEEDHTITYMHHIYTLPKDAKEIW